jgi:enoyl-CoA hydratase
VTGSSTEAEPEVLFARRGHLAVITLNRPRAINALTHGMVTAIRAALEEWATDDSVRTVVLTGSGGRGLCAGGDIVSLYHDAKDGDGAASAGFWRDEYRLDAAIASYPKPYVAIMHGVVLGGGIGLSAHGSHRIVTERSNLGMPETGIGFVPDVGGSWLLARAPGELGTHLALTAGSVRAGDAIAAGLADSFVPSERIPSLLDALESMPADDAIRTVAQPAPASGLLADRPWIDEAYRGADAPAILGRLRALGTAPAIAAADAIAAKSPIAVAVALESLRRARALASLEAALAQEYRVSLHALRSHDFAEGVRAQVIDKDRQPRWRPATIADVDPVAVAAYFEPPASGDLTFPAHGSSTLAS